MRKRVVAVPSTDVCGACDFCRAAPDTRDEYLCWVLPPSITETDEGISSHRGLPTGADSPKCHLYTPRRNS